mgnify:CR=1 FL=1
MENFLSLKLEETLFESLAKINFKTPTPIQAKAIPVALEGKDILGTAQTGTGKTGAFGIPLVNYLLKTKKDTALVMTPTRELATQVMQTMNNLVGRGNIRTALLIGGDSMQKQHKQKSRCCASSCLKETLWDSCCRGSACCSGDPHHGYPTSSLLQFPESDWPRDGFATRHDRDLSGL